MGVLRSVSGFDQVLDRQMKLEKAEEPKADEADHLFLIRGANDMGHIMEKVIYTIQH